MPLTDFVETVKFYRPSFGNPLSSMLMREAFPAFDPNPKDEEAARRARNALQDQMSAAKQGGAQRVFAVKGTTRRRISRTVDSTLEVVSSAMGYSLVRSILTRKSHLSFSPYFVSQNLKRYINNHSTNELIMLMSSQK
jgi:hypothetical protein